MLWQIQWCANTFCNNCRYSSLQKYVFENLAQNFSYEYIVPLYKTFWNFTNDVTRHDYYNYNSRIFETNTKMYLQLTRHYCKHIPSKKLVYNINSDLEHTISAKDSFITCTALLIYSE